MAEDWQTQLLAENERLKKDKAALQSELRSTGDTDKDDDSNVGVIKKALLAEVPGYIQNIDMLANSSDNEGVRLAANKWLIEVALTDKLKVSQGTAEQQFKDFLEKLQGNRKKKEEAK